MIDGISCDIGASFGCYVGAWLFYLSFNFYNNRRTKK